MENAIIGLQIAAAVLIGLIPPVIVYNLTCRISGIDNPPLKKTLMIIIIGFIISTFIEMFFRQFNDLPGATAIIVFCVSLWIIFTLLCLGLHKVTAREAGLLAGMLTIVIFIYTVAVPPEFNAYAISRSAIWWMVEHI